MIRVVRAHLNVDAQTHAGMTGKNNEDRYAVASFMLDKRDRTPVLFAVLDADYRTRRSDNRQFFLSIGGDCENRQQERNN